MSKRSRTMVETAVELRTRAELEAEAGREFVRGLKGTESEARIAHDGIAEGTVKKVEVYGVDGNGKARDRMEFVAGDDGSMMLVTRQGRCPLGAIDGSLPRLIEHQRRAFERRGLRSQVQYTLRDEIYRDEARANAVRARLGLVSTKAPEWFGGGEPKTTLEMRSGHTGTLVRMSKASNKR